MLIVKYEKMLTGKTAASGKFGVIPDPDIRECDGEWDEHKCFICVNEAECRKEDKDGITNKR